MKIGTLCSAIIGTALLVTGAFAQDSIILGLADANNGETQQIALEILDRIVVSAPGGTRIQVYNATTPRRLADFKVPSIGNATGRKNRVRGEVAPVIQHLRQSRSVRAGQGSALDIPEFLNVVGSSVRNDGGTTRVILLGSPFHTASEDESMNFRPGFYPSDGHIGTTSRRSVFGSADKSQLLDGVLVDFALVGEIGTPRERAPVQRFWALWIGAQGGTLTSFLPTADVVVERALEGLTDAVISAEIDTTDGRIVMLPVQEIPVPVEEHEPEPAPKPIVEPVREPTPDPTPEPEPVIGVAVVIVIDGTSSQEHALPNGGTMLLDVADIGSTAGDLLQLGVVVARDRASTDRFPLTTIDRGDDSPGMAALRTFVTEKNKLVYVVDGAANESGGTRTGETRMVTALEPLISHADLESGVREGIDMLRASAATRKILIMAGDVGTAESDGDPMSISAQDLASAERTKLMVDRFSHENPDARIVTLFTGNQSGFLRHREQTISLFRELADRAGDRGTYTTDFDAIETIVVRAILGN